MTIIDRIHLTDLFNHIQKRGAESVLAYWRQMKSAEPSHCQACIFELMVGRRCCCMCLEASLNHTSLRLHLDDEDDERIRATISSVESHRSRGCGLCTSMHQD